MTDTSRFERAVGACRSAFSTRDWQDAITWHEAAWHAWEVDLQPAVAGGQLGGLLADRLRNDVEESMSLAARARLASTRQAPDDLPDCIDHLRAMIVRAPQREELRRLLMVALVRAGLPEEALTAYEAAASHAEESTGLEPSAALRSIRDRVAAGEPLPPEEEDLPFVVLSAPGREQRVIVLKAEETTTLGRADDRDIPITWDGAVSRQHAEFRPDGTRHVLEDIGSSNGTRLNGRELTGALHLVDGDVISIGSTTVIYRNPAGAPAASVEASSGTRIRVMPTPSAVINPARPEETVEELDVTILFCDLRGYTSASGAMTPQRARELLDVFYDLGADAITRHGGTVLQMAGDEIYACFGAPVPQPDHATRGYQAALELQAREPMLARELEARGLPPVRFGIGLNSGAVAPFAIGASDRRQLGLVGTTVNVAARLCSEAGPGQVVYASSVRERSHVAVVGAPTGPLELKNVERPIEAFRIG